jgi:hypothetical protein
MKAPECIDCIAEGATRWRPIKAGGPRSPLCVSHARARKRTQRARAHELRLEKNFSISAQLYWELYKAQGGKCYVCRVASGKTKRLAVEHDHEVARNECNHDPNNGCPHCIRGLACGRCNKLVAFLGPDALARAITLQMNPPAQRFMRGEGIRECEDLMV